ncbi:MAG: hypothetical protein JOZ81_32550 [Chloroflexi bacterium]|nr:hypothetical protein [Chloroflexota bacterium]
MSVVRSFLGELRERRLLPVVAVLVVAIVAVPLVLAKSPAPVPAPAPSSASGLPVSGNAGTPSLSVASAPSVTPPSGPARDPFRGSAIPGGSASSGGTSAAGAAAGAAASAAGSTAAAGASGSSSSPTGGSTGSATEPSTTPTPPPSHKPTVALLTPTQAYHVALAITNASGDLNQIDPLERMSVLPSQQNPLLVELGVLRGGGRVLFAVQPAAVVSGPGSCTPGPIDCQILSLAPGQTETLSSSNGSVSRLLFAVTAITADQYPSAAAADKARQNVSADGRRLLSNSTLTALSLFPYDPSLGAVVDLRNLSVEGQ